MSWGLLLWVAAAMLAGFLGWGAWLLRRGVGGSMQRLVLVEIGSIPALAEECRRTVRERLRTDLDPRDAEGTARALDALVLDGRLRSLFAAQGYEMRFAEPAGALLGELVRRHTGAEWAEDALGPPMLVLHRPAGAVELRPFLVALRHHTHGRPGHLHAWVTEAIGR
jgi:hypothetical protein